MTGRLEDFLGLVDRYAPPSGGALPPRQPLDLGTLAMFAGPAIMAAAGRPGASFGGALGEGLSQGVQLADRDQERRERAARQAEADKLARLQLGAQLFTASQKETKPLSVVEVFDERTGRPQKMIFNPATGATVPIGGAKVDDVNGILADVSDGKGGTRKALVHPRTGQEIAQIGAGDPGKPPPGFQWIDPQNPAAGVRPIPGYQEGVAQGEAMRPFTLPEGGARYQGTAAAPGGAPPSYSAIVRGFENNTGNPAARNPQSTATGDGQFLEGTWLDVWPRIAQRAAPILSNRGIDPARLDERGVLALRAIPEIAALGIDEYRTMTAPTLRQATGRDPTAAESNIAHFLGPGDAAKVLVAPPETPLERLVSPEAFERNRAALAGKTAGQLRAEFDRRHLRGQGVANAPGQRHPTSGRPIINNPDGSISTEESITVTEAGLNGGRPTNIPTIWDGKRLSPEEAIRRAAQSGQRFESFATIQEAEAAARARSDQLGRAYQSQAGQAQAGTLQPIAERAPSSRFERAYDQEEGKALAKERNEIADAAKAGREAIAQANALQTLLEQTGTGKTVPLTTSLKAWAKSVGFDLEAAGFRDNVATAEAASRIARELSLKFIQQTKGAISNAEMQIFLEMVPTLSNTPEGNKILLGAMRAVAKRQVDMDRAARAYETRPNGRFDRGFSDELDAIFARHPLLPEGMRAQAAPPAPAGAAAPPPRGSASREAAPVQGAANAQSIRGMSADQLRSLDPKKMDPASLKAAADRWEELNRELGRSLPGGTP